MNITEAVKRACEEPTLVEALAWICIWESERVIAQVLINYEAGTEEDVYDTCFKYCLQQVMKEYIAQDIK